MTPHEALGILDQAAGLAPLSRGQHLNVQQASQTIGMLLHEIDEKSKVRKQEVPIGEAAATDDKKGKKAKAEPEAK